jgi:hypothetical protein
MLNDGLGLLISNRLIAEGRLTTRTPRAPTVGNLFRNLVWRATIKGLLVQRDNSMPGTVPADLASTRWSVVLPSVEVVAEGRFGT